MFLKIIEHIALVKYATRAHMYRMFNGSARVVCPIG